MPTVFIKSGVYVINHPSPLTIAQSTSTEADPLIDHAVPFEDQSMQMDISMIAMQ